MRALRNLSSPEMKGEQHRGPSRISTGNVWYAEQPAKAILLPEG